MVQEVLDLAFISKKININNLKIPFLRQSIRSDYCAVYAVGMFLSILGHRTDRLNALSLFGLKRTNPRYQGTPLSEIKKVIYDRIGLLRLRWMRYSKYRYDRLINIISHHMIKTNSPTLLIFNARHKRRGFHCSHVVTITGIEKNDILAIDPLGNQPHYKKHYNIKMGSPQPKKKHLHINGAPYFLEIDKSIAVLLWDNITKGKKYGKSKRNK